MLRASSPHSQHASGSPLGTFLSYTTGAPVIDPLSMAFYLLSLITLGGGLGMITARNAVVAALYLVVALLGQAGLFVTLQATFLGVVQVLVYAGAVMVLFVFVVMLLDLNEVLLPDQDTTIPVLLRVLLASAFAGNIWVLLEGGMGRMVHFSVAAPEGTVSRMGERLFVDFPVPFEITSILLLAAMLGVIYISRPATKEGGS